MIVYVAGSSDEIDRARACIALLRADGIHVTSSWPENVAAVGSANPRDAAQTDRARWANNCVDELVRADTIWFLAPSGYGHGRAPHHGRGAYFEFGYALAGGMTAIASGDTKQSIFTALAHEFATDEEALVFIQHLARRS